MSTTAAGDSLWTPSADAVAASATTALMRDVGVADYDALWRWSTEDVGRFWGFLWKRFDIQADGDPTVALADASMPGAQWFPDVRLSMPEHVFRNRTGSDVAIRFKGEDTPLGAWTWDELREHTTRIRAGLEAMGVTQGDRVAGYLPNGPHTIAAFLATASLGAVWSCCSPDFGTRTVIDRFAQIEPTVLLTCDGYRYNGKAFDRTQIADEIAAALPTLKATARLPYLGNDGDWDERFPPTDAPLTFERVAFDHPLWILYSSGTTGLPKAIVHGHGGILLEHLKVWRIGQAVNADDRVLWTTTTGWVMWNLVVGVLLSDASIVIYEGSVAHPDLGALWQLIDEAGITVFGTGAAYLHGCLKAGLAPEEDHDLTRLRAVGSTGSPLSPEGFRWVYDHVGPDTWLFSTSGGTDIASGFVGGSDVLPVRAGELQARCLGVAAEAWDDDGNPLIDEVGELVITKPMPSMPVKFWNDEGDERYRDSYFTHYDVQPAVWRQGDWIRITASGSSVIYGRSDSTINRGGIRMGTAEIYAAVLALDEITDALVVDVPPPDGNADSRMTMFVVLADADAAVGDDLTKKVVAAVRRDASPRHVPDELVAVPEVPRTLTGKVLEVPVKKLLMGRDPDSVVSRDALANAAAFDWFVAFARDKGLSAS
ncbi:Acetyl-coenzyme A synthetase [Paraconexibacter sp. AEG42_29]|uniref:Acetyl-coenzyme A synthetase n=1 Tax=Paraconexibacter sp. AEG42_29 TaxID=2997339 RepID=A0AAU7B093_9ACTN